MKISVDDHNDSGINAPFARAIGATTDGRFIHIPYSKGKGSITGFSWGKDLRVSIRDYYLNEDVELQWINHGLAGMDNVVFVVKGIFSSLLQRSAHLKTEQQNISIGTQTMFSELKMPANTHFGSVAIRVSKTYLFQMFGHVDHPVVSGVLEAGKNLLLEIPVSPDVIRTASEMLGQNLPSNLESHYYKLKTEELLCFIVALLLQRDAVPLNTIHFVDLKAVFAVKEKLLSRLSEAPNIGQLAIEAGMSEPKLRSIFKQTFGKRVFEYYQHARMQQAAKLLKENHRSVSEVGYQLGFTNLSHFSRVFEQIIGLKPKRYSKGN